MKIIVPVKWVLDYNLRPKIIDNKINIDNLKKSINPFDAIALEEAIRLKEKNIATEIIALTVGSVKDGEVLRHAYAMGADKAIHVISDKDLSSLNIAKIIAKIATDNQADLIITGKQAIDKDNNHTAQMIAALLDLPLAIFAAKIDINKDKKSVTVECETDEGTKKLLLGLPAVISCDLRLNEPRYCSLINIMKAKSKAIITLNLSEFNIADNQIKTLNISPPPARQKGVKLENISQLYCELKKIGAL